MNSRIATLAATVVLGLAACAQAAPMLPKPFMFYDRGRGFASFRHATTFYMYFHAFRAYRHGISPSNINLVKMYTEARNVEGKRLPPPPWYKLLRGGQGRQSTEHPPVKPPKPVVPEPTSMAILGGGVLFLIRRKREA